MFCKKIKKIVTTKELGLEGDTAGDILVDLQKMLPVSPLDIVLPDGVKLCIGSEKMEIKLSKHKELRSDIIEEILTEGTKLLLEENRRRDVYDKNRIKITMSLGDNTVYFAQGHLDRSPDGKVMPMYPILSRTDDTFVRVIDSIFTPSIYDLGSFLKRQHNRTLGYSEEDRTQEIAEKLGFVTVEKDDSVIDVQINGVTDSCMVTRLCIHSNEFRTEEKLLESIIDTYRNIQGLEENPLIIIGLNESIDITISRDKKIITIEHQYNEISSSIIKLIKTVIGFIITKETLENGKIEYNETIMVEGKSLAQRIDEKITKFVDIIDKIIEGHEHNIIFGAALITIPLIFLFFLYSKTNPKGSYFQAAIATIPPIIFATVITREYRKRSWIRTYGQKKFLAYILFFSVGIYFYMRHFGFNTYLEILFYITIVCVVITAGIMSLYILRKLSPAIERAFSPVRKLFSPITRRLHVARKSNIIKGSIFQNETMIKSANVLSMISDNNTIHILIAIFSMILRIVSSILGVIAVAIFAIAFLPMIGLFVLFNLLNRGYWKELNNYREDIIEKAVHKYRDERKLAPSCRVIFRTTECKCLKNPLSGTWKILSKKAPRFLTIGGFVDMIDKLVIREWL
jgi:hypothetical protein